jgi:ubiquinone/menaquinone biosynthesis C-methylase UbiE
MTEPVPDFDGVARAYRWLEYAALGPLLERTRECHLALLQGCSRALILGDGDGRFTARLLASAPEVRVEAVDLSGMMLSLLKERCSAYAARLEVHQADARKFEPREAPDVVVTHFFLDCLTQTEADTLVARLTTLLRPNTLWVVSDFRVPDGAMHWPAWVYVRTLYFAFRILTGLRTTRLPDHAAALERSGFVRVTVERRMFGVLTSEVWRTSVD